MLEGLNLRGSRLTFVETPEPSVTENDDGTVTYRCVFSVEYVSPDDVKTVAPYVCAHRIICRGTVMRDADSAKIAVVEKMIKELPVPTEQL